MATRFLGGSLSAGERRDLLRSGWVVVPGLDFGLMLQLASAEIEARLTGFAANKRVNGLTGPQLNIAVSFAVPFDIIKSSGGGGGAGDGSGAAGVAVGATM